MEREPKKSFGALVRRYRKKRGLLQVQAAKAFGIRQSYLSGIETGDKDPPSERVLAAIAEALALDANENAALLASIEESRATLRLPNHVTPSQRQLFFVLIRRSEHLSEAHVGALRAVANLQAA